MKRLMVSIIYFVVGLIKIVSLPLLAIAVVLSLTFDGIMMIGTCKRLLPKDRWDYNCFRNIVYWYFGAY